MLLDYKRWAEKQGRQFDSRDGVAIQTADLEACARDQNTEFKFGDVLILRTGFTEDMEDCSGEEQLQGLARGVTGIESNVETAKWIWNKHFSAVASDLIALEHVTVGENQTPSRLGEYAMLATSLLD